MRQSIRINLNIRLSALIYGDMVTQSRHFVVILSNSNKTFELALLFCKFSSLKVSKLHELSLVHISCEMPSLNLYISKNKGPMPKIQIDPKRFFSKAFKIVFFFDFGYLV